MSQLESNDAKNDAIGVVAGFALPHPPLLIPGIGDMEKSQVQATAGAYLSVCRQLADLRPQTIVVFSPHASIFRDGFAVSAGAGASGSFSQFGAAGAARRYSVRYDQQLVTGLLARLQAAGIAAQAYSGDAEQLDHGFLVPWHFIQQELHGDVEVVRIGLSGLSLPSHQRLGQCLAAAASELGRRVVVVASGDLSHRLVSTGPYGYDPAGPEFDQRVTALMASGDLDSLLALDEGLCEEAAECGLRSFVMLSGALVGLNFVPRLLAYEGPFGVGYAVASFVGESLPVALARAALADLFAQGGYPSRVTPQVTGVLKRAATADCSRQLLQQLEARQAGVFVSLHQQGQLRGCIGTIAACSPSVLDEIIQNAFSAACSDPRFMPLEANELEGLEVKVDVLGEPQPAAGIAQLDARRYGVIVSQGGRRGLLLPDLEGVDTPQRQIDIALQKAGIAASESYALQRFEVQRYT
jgi:AmmeMemoRadiSam system protein A/AmmeMemoRadiSam system protein B